MSDDKKPIRSWNVYDKTYENDHSSEKPTINDAEVMKAMATKIIESGNKNMLKMSFGQLMSNKIKKSSLKNNINRNNSDVITIDVESEIEDDKKHE